MWKIVPGVGARDEIRVGQYGDQDDRTGCVVYCPLHGGYYEKTCTILKRCTLYLYYGFSIRKLHVVTCRIYMQ